MTGDIISMYDMGVIFDVTDSMGIDRESVSVELGKEDPGNVRKVGADVIEIVVPISVPIEEWAKTLNAELENLGFSTQEP
mgnify:CR=1 FL=1